MFSEVFAQPDVPVITEKEDTDTAIYVLSRNSTRKKIMAYLNSIAAEKQTKTVILPMSYTTLAEYLSVDRSAMMRELKNLADEGIIERDGKKLRIFGLKNRVGYIIFYQ